MKILNLYAGIGGNRKLWGDNHEITAVELCPKIAKKYSELYPNDTLIVGDAHEYLINNFQNFDFMEWISVKEKYPENYSFVLATIKTDFDCWVEIVGFADGIYTLPGRGASFLVTHWMPIPLPAIC